MVNSRMPDICLKVTRLQSEGILAKRIMAMKNVIRREFQIGTQKGRIALIVFLTVAACFLTYYYHVILGIGTVITHFYYIPIILACLWWQRIGLVIAAFLSSFLIFSHVFLRTYALTPNDYLRALMFMVVAFVLVALTERIAKAEEELRIAHEGLERRVEERTAELLAVNDELDNYVHVVSHDLKTPITYIQGFSSQLLENYQDRLDDKGRICIERINASARRMESLVSDLLSLSSIGQVTSNFEEVPSSEIVKDVTSGLHERIQDRGIEVVIGNNFPKIYCDKKRIYQVFENLLVNAVKFTKGAMKPKIEIGYRNGQDSHQFFVRDNGVGIDSRYHRKIFEKFERVKETADEEGTGLGLAIVERIVKNHGGRVWVQSQPGKGATFCFSLPKALINAQAPNKEAVVQ